MLTCLPLPGEYQLKGVHMAKVKITVVKKVNNRDMFGDNPPLSFTAIPEWDRLELGQSFISEGGCPEGFCGWAFAAILERITRLCLSPG